MANSSSERIASMRGLWSWYTSMRSVPRRSRLRSHECRTKSGVQLWGSSRWPRGPVCEYQS